jgi:hypothetical protein
MARIRLSKIKPMKKKQITQQKYSIYFILLTLLFVTALVSANVIAVKIITVLGRHLPAGIIVFPISYILGDVITEVYGYKKAKVVIWLGFLMNLLFVGFASFALVIPPAIFWEGQEAFEIILGFTPRLLLASLVGYLAGSFSNAYLMSVIKKLTNGKYLWIRTITSTIVGEGVDSLLFISISFLGVQPNIMIISMIINQWLFKTAYEVLVTPVTYKLVNYFKNKESIKENV